VSEQAQPSERVIDVQDIDPRHRHTIIFQLIQHLPEGGSLQLVADHDPKPLRYQAEATFGARFRWDYLEEGPDAWRVRVRHAA